MKPGRVCSEVSEVYEGYSCVYVYVCLPIKINTDMLLLTLVLTAPSTAQMRSLYPFNTKFLTVRACPKHWRNFRLRWGRCTGITSSRYLINPNSSTKIETVAKSLMCGVSTHYVKRMSENREQQHFFNVFSPR